MIRWFLLGLVLVLTACSSVGPGKKSKYEWSGDRGELLVALRGQYDQWLGTPYKYGGSSKAGVDCSAFVQQVMRNAFGYALPRATYDQQREGDPISRRSIIPGDLVFFQISAKQPHVGIYVGEDLFIHAASSVGVSTASLNDPYWRSRYVTAKRVLPFLRE
ncbi:MAG: NlpC/P60 family protein [Limnobacter sp.]|nr:NlpC/P60 family protein [Limnobacter sp.]